MTKPDNSFDNNSLLQIFKKSNNPLAVFFGSELYLKIANDAMLNIWSKNQSTIGQKMIDIFYGLNENFMIQCLTEVWKSRKVHKEHNIPSKFSINGDHSIIYYDFCFEPILADEDMISCILVTAIKVTELVKTKNLLKEITIQEQQITDSLTDKNSKLSLSKNSLGKATVDQQKSNQTLQKQNIDLKSDNEVFKLNIATLDSTNIVISKVSVNANGTFSFPSTILEANNNYSVAIDTRNVSGNYTFSSPLLPSGWEVVGEDFGTNNLLGNGVEAGLPNLRIPIRFNSSNPNVTGLKFGIVSAEDICTQPVNGSGFIWNYTDSTAPSNPVTQTFNQPAANYGFVLDITKLDNSFNMIINGTPLATQEIEFQSSGTSGMNIQFVDNSSYEANTPFIYNMTGTDADPIIRVAISPTGSVSMFGSKSSGGPLFPLKLINGNTFNTITWNTTGNNTVIASQNVVGATNMSGRGYGLNRVACVCTKPGALGTPSEFTSVGITTKSNLTVADWPKSIPNGHLALDSTNKGLIITHVTNAQRDALIPIDGMLIYNTDLGCVQLYRGNNPSVDNARRGWNCLTKGCNK